MTEEKQGFAYFKQVGIGALSGFVTLTLIILGLSIGGGAVTPTSEPSQSTSALPSATPTSTSGVARTCSVKDLALVPELGTLQAVVMNADTDEVLFDRNGSAPGATASSLKVLTAAAALTTLGANYRVSTSVYADPADPGTIVLVGAGDPTLSRTAPGQDSVYKGAPKLSDLATKVREYATANNITSIKKIVLDATLFTDPKWEPTWERSEQTEGYMSEVSALQVDGDRKSPNKETSPRSTTPVLNAGKYFKNAIGAIASGARLVEAKAGTNLTLIHTVQSQPISTWIKHMLQVSDNTEAEFLARLTAIKLGYSGSFASIDLAIKKSLQVTGLDSTGISIKDGSGLSDLNRVPPIYFARLMKLIMNQTADFNIIKEGLPISGESGSLSDRFKGDNVDAAGHVFAKTGWIKHGYTLTGIIEAKDGTHLTFAVYALGNVSDSAKLAIDNLVTGFYRCGDTLSNE